ncbi:NAD-binding protein [Puniceicoccaceae bacterium K14]|nr:NAD-binding protein [Puniceicoccaceae bacterium K14]
MKIHHENHIIICNFPNAEKVLLLLDELQATEAYKSCEVVIISNDIDELPGHLQKRGVHFVKGLPTSEDVLHQANIIHSDGVFIIPKQSDDPSSDAETYAIGSIIELIEAETKSPIKTVVELVSAGNLRMMERAQTDGIIVSSGINENMIVQEFLNPGIHKTFEQLISNREGSQFYVHSTSLRDIPFADIQIAAIKHSTNMQLIGIVKDGKHVLNPPKHVNVESGDQLIILADKLEDFLSIEKDIESQRGSEKASKTP